MAGEQIVIAQLDLDTEALIKSATETKKSIDDLRESQKELKKQGDSNSATFVKNEVEIKKLNKTYNEQKKVIGTVVDAEKEQQTATEKTTKLLNTQESSINGLRQSNKDLLAVRNQVDGSTKKGQEQITKINAKLDENNEKIKENVSGYEQQKIGIGAYGESIKEMFPALGGLLDRSKKVAEGFKAQTQAARSQAAANKLAGNSFLTLSGTLKLFRLALISTGIGAFVVALGSLITYLSTTQEGIDKINKVIKPFTVGFQRAIGIVQEFGKEIFEAFSNPKQLMVDLMSFLESQVTNRLKAFGKIFKAILEFDTDALTDGLFQLTTGVEDLTGKVQKGLDGLSEFAKESNKIAQDLNKVQIDIENAEIRQVKNRAESLRIIKEQNKISEDTSNTLSEREAASKKSIEESNKLLQDELKVQDLRIKKKEIENSLNDTSRADELELAELIAKRTDLETSALELQTTLTNKLNTIRNQVANEQKKEAEAKKKEAEAQQKEEDDEKLRQITEYEQRKRALLDEIEIQNAATDEEKDIIKKEQELLKREEELIALGLSKEQEKELLKLYEEQEAVELEEIRKKHRDIQIKGEEDLAKQRLDVRNKSFDSAVALAGAETRLGKGLLAIKEIFGIKESLIELRKVTFRSKTAIAKSSMAIAEGGAQTAAIGFPQNIPLLIGFAAQVGGIISAVKRASSGVNASTFADGGVVTGKPQRIGSGVINNGSNMSTPLSNGDDTLAYVKQGEVILNQDQQERAGGSEFFRSIGVPNFANGGMVGTASSSGVSNLKVNSQASEIGKVVAAELNKVKVVAIVEDITSAQEEKAEIISGANI